MSSDFERLLRDGRESLPEPNAAATRRGRARALAATRHRRPRARVAVMLGAIVVLAIALGLALGSLVAGNGTAAREPSGLGFLPEPGWFALQSAPPGVRGQPVVAAAANVPFARGDTVHGLADPSGIPYSTLLALPHRGIVMIASVVPASEQPVIEGVPQDYRETALPLRAEDAVPYFQFGTQVRPEKPLGEYQLRALIRGNTVDLTLFYGTLRPSPRQISDAQRQLDRLMIRPAPKREDTSRAGALATTPELSVIDRTYVCSTVVLGGLYQVESRAHPGQRIGGSWTKLAYAVVSSGGEAFPVTGLQSAAGSSLAWVTAGTPSATTLVDTEKNPFPVLLGGTIGVNRSLCAPSSRSVPLTSTGLRGGPADPLGEKIDCEAPRRVFVRFRATVRTRARLSARARIFLATNAIVRDAKLATRTPSGKLLAYAEVADSGKARLFTARGCENS